MVRTGWPVAGSHNRTLPSASALASSLPSGLNATPFTPTASPVVSARMVRTGWPVAGSHNRTLPSASALASSLPSGLNATPITPHILAGGVGRDGADGLAGGRIPQPHPAVEVGAGQQLAVGAERHPVHAVRPPLGPGSLVWRADGLAGGRIPQPHRAVGVGAGQQLAVRAERHPDHGRRGPVGRDGCRTPWPVAGSHNRTVPSASALASSLPSGAERHPVHADAGAGGVGPDGAGGLAGGRIPQPHPAVEVGAGQQLAVRG